MNGSTNLTDDCDCPGQDLRSVSLKLSGGNDDRAAAKAEPLSEA